MSNSASSLSLAGSRVADPQSRQLTFKPCRRFLGRHRLGGCFEKLCHKVVCALAFALEVCSVASGSFLEPRDLRLQCLDLCRQRSNVAWLASAWWAGRVPYLSGINAHQSFAVR
jgi:hypothetical protein